MKDAPYNPSGKIMYSINKDIASFSLRIFYDEGIAKHLNGPKMARKDTPNYAILLGENSFEKGIGLLKGPRITSPISPDYDSKNVLDKISEGIGLNKKYFKSDTINVLVNDESWMPVVKVLKGQFSSVSEFIDRD